MKKTHQTTLNKNDEPRGAKVGHSSTATRLQKLVLSTAKRTKILCGRQTPMSLEALEEEFRWDYEAIKRDSPRAVPKTKAAQCKALLSLFKPTDRIRWTRLMESDGPEDSLAAEYLAKKAGTFWSMSPEVESDQLGEERRFLVIRRGLWDESLDDGWLFKFLVATFGMRLRAVVSHTSWLHAWFDPVEPELHEALSYWLPVLGICPKYCFLPNNEWPVPFRGTGTALIYLA